MLNLLFVAAALVAASPEAKLPDPVHVTRTGEPEVVHLDVVTLEDAKAIRAVILVSWARSSEDDIIIEPMLDQSGRSFYCVHTVRK